MYATLLVSSIHRAILRFLITSRNSCKAFLRLGNRSKQAIMYVLQRRKCSLTALDHVYSILVTRQVCFLDQTWQSAKLCLSSSRPQKHVVGTSGRRHLRDGALRLCHPFNGHSLPMVTVVDPDDRRSSLLNGHEVMIRSIGKCPGKLLVLRHSWNRGIIPTLVGFGKPPFDGGTFLFAVLGGRRGRRRYQGIRFNVSYCSFVLEPRLITPGLGNRPSVTRHYWRSRD